MQPDFRAEHHYLSISFGFTPAVNDTFQLFGVTGNKSGDFASVSFTNAGFTGSFDASTGILTVTAVPEPSVWILLTGSLMVVTVLVRRSQKKSALAL